MFIKNNYPLKQLNTFGIDVKADTFAEFFSAQELFEILSRYETIGLNKYILGGGSNVLFVNDFKGIIIKNSIAGINVINEDKDCIDIEAGAGVIWNEFVKYCIDKNFGGIENLSLIPGTVGAAPIQNIGAYGQEQKETFISLKGISLDNMQRMEFSKKECKFSYRDSVFKNELKNKFVITHVKFRLVKNPSVNLKYESVKDEVKNLGLKNPSIKDISDIVIRIRKNKLPDPLKIGNAGSFFKNPLLEIENYEQIKKSNVGISGRKVGNFIKVPAAWLIEKCGWKGKTFGNVGVHDKQPLVIVNYGNANGQEILDLAMEIKKSVLDTFGINLVEEVNII